MTMALIGHSLFSTFITGASYLLSLQLFYRLKKLWLNPLYTATILLALLLAFLKVDYSTYSNGTSIFSILQGTAVVSMAIPLYLQWPVIKKHSLKISFSIAIGSFSGMAFIWLTTKALLIKTDIIASLMPKSATLPVALSVSESLGGKPTLTVLFVLLSALFSLILGPSFFNWVNIKSDFAKSLSLGACAQALGVNKAFQWGEEAGAIGSVGMTTSAVLISFLIPLFAFII